MEYVTEKRVIRVSTKKVDGVEGTLIEKYETGFYPEGEKEPKTEWKKVKFIPNGDYVTLDRALNRYRMFGWDFEFIDD